MAGFHSPPSEQCLHLSMHTALHYCLTSKFWLWIFLWHSQQTTMVFLLFDNIIISQGSLPFRLRILFTWWISYWLLVVLPQSSQHLAFNRLSKVLRVFLWICTILVLVSVAFFPFLQSEYGSSVTIWDIQCHLSCLTAWDLSPKGITHSPNGRHSHVGNPQFAWIIGCRLSVALSFRYYWFSNVSYELE